MATQAKVTSTEALETFRSSLIIFLAKARRALDDQSDEVRRMRQWVTHDQMTHWEGELRRRTKQLEQAQQELMSARLSNQQSAIMARQMNVAKCQRAIQDAEQKLRRLKGWSQNFDSATDPIIKRMERLRGSLSDLPKAIAYLIAIQKTLEDYAQSAPPPDTGAMTSAANGDNEAGVEAPATEAAETAETEADQAPTEPAPQESPEHEPATPSQS